MTERECNAASLPRDAGAPPWALRLAREADIPALEVLIPLSARHLQTGYYTPQQIEAAFGPIIGVDRTLIVDGTYFVVECGGDIIGCGGWSKRNAFFGGDADRSDAAGGDGLLDPAHDAARIRAFFVHPDCARRGIGRALLRACEQAALQAGFQRIDLVATLAGEPLYAAHGYAVVERYDVPLPAEGLSYPAVSMTKVLTRSQDV